MPLISQQILSLIGGVSQQADKQRASSQMESQLNVFDSITYGKIKRPPTTHVAMLASSTWEDVYIHPVNRDAADKYHVCLHDGTVQVFDGITGAEYPVLFPQGQSYLTLETTGGTFEEPFTFTDDFVDTSGTDLDAHVSTSGPGWTQIPGTVHNPSNHTDYFTNGALIESSGLLFPAATGAGAWAGYTYDEVPSTPDVTMQVNILNSATPDNNDFILGARLAIVGTTLEGYGLHVVNPNYLTGATIKLERYNSNNTTTTLGTATGQPAISGYWADGATHAILFTLNGSTLTASVDGIVVLTETDTTYADAGLCGVWGKTPGSNQIYEQDLVMQFTESVTLPPSVQSGFRCATVQDTTFIANQTINVEPTSGETSEVRYPEALITVALADYATNYFVTLNNITVGFATPAPSAPGSRTQLGTDYIAQALYDALIGNATLNAAFYFTLLGETNTPLGASTIYVTSQTTGLDFTISGNDGLNDGGLVVVKGVVQNIEALPARALNGMVIKVQPDPQNNVDVAYYAYDNYGSPNLGGAWVESIGPGLLTNLNPETMPWQLTRSGDVVAGYPAAGPIPVPAITNGYGSNTYLSPTGTHARGGVIGDNESALVWAFSATAPYEITFVYDIDVGNLPSGYFVTLVFENLDTSATYPFVYAGGTGVPNITQTFTSATNASSGWKATLTYSTGGTPGSGGTPELTTAQQGSVAFHSNPAYNGGSGSFGTDFSGINGQYYNVSKSDILTFNSVWEYAAGVQISLALVGSTTTTYTPTTNLSATALCTALAANFSVTGYTFAALANVLTVTKTSGSPAAATVTYAWNNAEQYYNGALELAPNSLVGYLFQDLTDGSSAIVTANGISTITFAAGLAGGTTNSIRANDLCSVTGLDNQIFFVCQPCNWTARDAGDDTTNPFPSFTYNTINEIGFTSGRLILLSGENVVCSGSDDVFDFFRTTVTQLLDTDRIDVQANSDTVSDWYALVHWAEGCWLFAGNVQAQLPTQPALSNATVSIEPQTKYQTQPTLRPLAMDRRIYMTRLRSPNSGAPVTEVLRYQRIRFPYQGFIAENATKAIPTYLAGTPLFIVGDPVLEVMVLLTSAYPNQLYPYVFHYDEQQQLQMESWSTWEIDPGATILSIDFLDGVMGLIVQRTDGVYLEYLDFQMALYEAAD